MLFGEPVLVVLAAPLRRARRRSGCVHRPTSAPVVRARLDHVSLYEGQGTRSRLDVTAADGVEHVTRVSAQAPYVALHPRRGRVAGWCATASRCWRSARGGGGGGRSARSRWR